MPTSAEYQRLPYDPTKLKRELAPFYIPTTNDEQKEMLKTLGLNKLDDLYAHISSEVKFSSAPKVCERLQYPDLINHVEKLAAKNKPKICFIGDGLKFYKVQEIVPFVCDLRNLVTAYTPYQPERSQGTLRTLWAYSSAITAITGFEAINASLYERATCLFEAIQTATRIVPGSSVALVCESIYPGDYEVIETLALETKTKIIKIPVNTKTGVTDLTKVLELYKNHTQNVAAIIFPQVNNLGNLENVHAMTDFCSENKIQSIAIIDPILLGMGGLTRPVDFGAKKQGADMIVAEGQHLAIAPNFGGPGLGIFGIRYNEQNKNSIRSAAGRFVGKTKDSTGRESLCMVLSTREQHIRREKATSNICSNQSFVATIAGAAILERGDEGLKESVRISLTNAHTYAATLTSFEGVSLAYPETAFANEFVLKLPVKAQDLINTAAQNGIHLGVDVSKRAHDITEKSLLITFTDIHSKNDLENLEKFFATQFKKSEKNEAAKSIPEMYKNFTPAGIKKFTLTELKKYYSRLATMNVSPDDHIYPLGSCTMKYNPYINEYAAGLKGFTDIHPQAPLQDIQGSLEVLYETQEMFKAITGLSGLTTQPVAGAQGELVGLKLFQAYHRKNGEGDTRNILLIPRSAHGTNPATATMAGFETKNEDAIDFGIVTIEANDHGEMNYSQVTELVKKYGKRISGIMVTNPNTSGVFETEFKKIADLVHSVGGLVYMDGANMNAIASWLDLGKLGVDAVHNNLHKTWTIPHGGGGPGDAIVAVSEKLLDFLPGIQVIKAGDKFEIMTPKYSIGSFHRHHGNFAHKVRCYTYIKALGSEGIRAMSAVAVLSARYLQNKFIDLYPTLPVGAEKTPRMHEFILTLSPETYTRMQNAGTPKAQAMARVGKLFLDFGLHAPTVAFPEIYGLMIEPTETYTKIELDHFVDVVRAIHMLINEHPEVLTTAPHFTPVTKIDEVAANKNLVFSDKLTSLHGDLDNPINPIDINQMTVGDVCQKILAAHKSR